MSTRSGRKQLSRPCRGAYTLDSQVLLLENFCGLFRHSLPGRRGDDILIYPSRDQMPEPAVPEVSEVPEREVLYTALKNHDFFESRPYYPGDDPRRINWKMMARHGELFIREGSGTLPSRSRVLIVLDPGEERLRRGYMRDSGSPGDRLIRSAAFFVEELRGSGCRIDLASPGVPVKEKLEKMGEHELEEILARVLPRRMAENDLPVNMTAGIMVFYFCTAVPEAVILERFVFAGRRVLIFPGGTAEWKRAGCKEKGIRSGKASVLRNTRTGSRGGNGAQPGGWDIVYS